MFLLALLPSHLAIGRVEPASYPFPQPVLGEWRGLRGNLLQGSLCITLQAVDALPSTGDGRHSKVVKIPASGYRSWGGDYILSDQPALGNQRLSCWNGQPLQALACPDPKY